MFAKYFTKAFIPTGGVFITEAFAPKGFYVARYDADGLTSQPSWFETQDAAASYAAKLDRAKA